jgi:5-methylcytosine-specific restriction endonuclease McrA
LSKVCDACGSHDLEPRRRIVAGGAAQFRFQCLGCGRAVGSAIKKSEFRKPNDLALFDELLFAKFQARQVAELSAERQRERAEWFREHNVYLRSPAWRKRRDAVLERAKGLCEGCRDARAVHVHHLTYDHWQKELLWELVAVCEECHEQCHEHMKAPN